MDAISLYLGILTTLCLAWASYEDLKKRLVPDKIWAIQILLAIPTLVLWFNENTDFIPRVLVVTNIILGFVLGVSFVMLGALGGGDGKAIIAISISFPFFGITSDVFVFMPPIFFFMINMLLFILLFALVLVVINLRSIKTLGPLFSETSGNFAQKLGIFISGRRLHKERIERLIFEDPAEIFDEQWKLHTPIFSKAMTDEEFEIMETEAREKAWQDIRDSERTYMWTRPQPPGLVFLLLAHLMWMFYGSPFLFLFY